MADGGALGLRPRIMVIGHAVYRKGEGARRRVRSARLS